MADASRKTYEKNNAETIVNSGGIQWLNEKRYKRRIRS